MKPPNLEFPEQDSAAATVQKLTDAIAENESQIAEGRKQIAHAEAMLASVVADRKTATNELDLKALKDSETAWLATVGAYAASNAFHQSVVDKHKLEIDSVLKRFPQARQDN